MTATSTLTQLLNYVKWCLQNCLIYSVDPVGASSIETYIVVCEMFERFLLNFKRKDNCVSTTFRGREELGH